LPKVGNPRDVNAVQGTKPANTNTLVQTQKATAVPGANQAPPTLAAQAGALGQNQSNSGTQTTGNKSKPASTNQPHTLAERVKTLFHHQEQTPATNGQKTPAANTGTNSGVAQKAPA